MESLRGERNSNGIWREQVRLKDLPCPDSSGLPLAHGIWGEADQLGTLNNITADATLQAARLVRAGARFNLNLPLHVPLGMLPEGAHRRRRAPVQTLLSDTHSGLLIRDEKVDEFYTQGSTQWDGLTHVGDPLQGFYNGVSPEEISQKEGTKNGIEHFARFGIATRGVLIDLPRFYARHGLKWKSVESIAVEPDTLAQCLLDSDTRLVPGDVLLVRTGWVSEFLAAAPEERKRLYCGRDYSGLSGSCEMWEFLWDNEVAAVASDAVAVEVFPLEKGRPSLHLAIARLGLVLGELFYLEDLADYCASTGDCTCFFVSMPLNLRGGVGSPANAIALK